MISFIKGRLVDKLKNSLVVEVGGIGYLVEVGQRLWQQVEVGEEVELRTWMIVGDNELRLCGFETREEVEMFGWLLEVSGIGPKTAAAIVSQTETDKVRMAISKADVEFFKKVKGVGQKAAQKIIIELKGKIGGLADLDLNGGVMAEDEVFLGLKQLGFDGGEIEAVIKKIPEEIVAVEDRLGWCLKNMK